jgi:hypothetical protein
VKRLIRKIIGYTIIAGLFFVVPWVITGKWFAFLAIAIVIIISVPCFLGIKWLISDSEV